jgi:hypothetical protein
MKHNRLGYSIILPSDKHNIQKCWIGSSGRRSPSRNTLEGYGWAVDLSWRFLVVLLNLINMLLYYYPDYLLHLQTSPKEFHWRTEWFWCEPRSDADDLRFVRNSLVFFLILGGGANFSISVGGSVITCNWKIQYWFRRKLLIQIQD